MNIILAMLGGLAGAATSGIAVFAATVMVLKWMHVPDREGALGYAGIFAGLFAACIGLVLGVMLALRLRNVAISALFLQAPLTLVALVAVAGGIYLVWERTAERPFLNRAPPVMEFQLQAPPNSGLPDPSRINVQMQTGRTTADVRWREKQGEQADGRPILDGYLELFLRSADRMLVVTVPGGSDYLFKPRLPGSPLNSKYQNWSAWQPADDVFTPGSSTGQKVKAADSYQIRYRMLPD